MARDFEHQTSPELFTRLSDFENLQTNCSWKFQNRDLKEIRKFGWIVVAFGILTSLFVLTFLLGPLVAGVAMLMKGQNAGWVFVGFAAVSLLGGLGTIKLWLGGLAVVRNKTYCVISIEDDMLKVCEYLGWIKLRRETSLLSIKALEIGPYEQVAKSKASGSFIKKIGTVDALAARTLQEPFPVVFGYSRDVLEKFASVLRGELLERVPELKLSITSSERGVRKPSIREQRHVAEIDLPIRVAGAVPSTAEETNDHSPLTIELPEKPGHSSIMIHHRDGAATIEIPAQGFWKGSHGLIAFAFLWNGFMLVFTTLVLFAGGPVKQWSEIAIVTGFLAMFWFVGLVLLAVGIHLSTRKTMIGVFEETIMVSQQSWLRKKWDEYSIDQIHGIEVGPSRIEVNDEPVNELKIHLRGGESVGLLSQCDDQQLDYVAAHLASLAKINTTDKTAWSRWIPEDDETMLEHPPEGIQFEAADGNLRIIIARAPLKTYLPLSLFGMIFLAVGIGIGVFLFSGFVPNQVPLGGIAEMAFPMMFCFVFSGIGTAMVISSFIAMRRSFVISVDYRNLTILRQGIGSHKQWSFPVEQIQSLDMADSGMKVNGQAWPELQIETIDGKSVNFMAGRKESQIAFVAGVLCRTIFPSRTT